jgi:hypothetical protein
MPKRYTYIHENDFNEPCIHNMQECVNGEWVKFDDIMKEIDDIKSGEKPVAAKLHILADGTKIIITARS